MAFLKTIEVGQISTSTFTLRPAANRAGADADDRADKAARARVEFAMGDPSQPLGDTDLLPCWQPPTRRCCRIDVDGRRIHTSWCSTQIVAATGPVTSISLPGRVSVIPIPACIAPEARNVERLTPIRLCWHRSQNSARRASRIFAQDHVFPAPPPSGSDRSKQTPIAYARGATRSQTATSPRRRLAIASFTGARPSRRCRCP